MQVLLECCYIQMERSDLTYKGHVIIYIWLSLFTTPASNTNPYGPKSGIIPNL